MGMVNANVSDCIQTRRSLFVIPNYRVAQAIRGSTLRVSRYTAFWKPIFGQNRLASILVVRQSVTHTR